MKPLVKITKIKACEDPEYATPDWKDYEVGKLNGNISLPADYYLEGYLLNKITKDKSVVVERISRNGEKIGGFFTTSLVTEIFDGGFKTLNSVYKIDYIM
jgi:hypothetical protein